MNARTHPFARCCGSQPRVPAWRRGLAALACVVSCLLPLAAPVARAESVFEHFVTVRGDQLYEGDQPFRFIAFNIPNLLLIEDNVAFDEANPWRLPDRFELTDALATARQLGGTVARTYVLSVRRTNDAPHQPKHVLGPGQFNEEAFRALDLALQVANEQGVRLIIPLLDNWSWMGGRAEYAGFRGKPGDAFWTDPQVIADFRETVRFIVTRTNTLTGVRYSEDKAILCWETGNEIESPASWTREMAAYLKRLDTNHPVMDGFHSSVLRAESLSMPEIDIVTTHHYPGGRRSFAELIRENAEKARDKKPYVVGEFGFVPTAPMEEAMKAIVETGISGGLLWSLRFRNRDGGFYWHSEPAGENQYKAFHWPPSTNGAAYDELTLMTLARSYAHQIRGTTVPPLPVPEAPGWLAPRDSGLSWQGSVGAREYVVERAASTEGPWAVVAHVDESAVQYRPLFVDESGPVGRWYYRVRARSESGASEPSNVAGPVLLTNLVCVDELRDFSRVHRRDGFDIQTRDSRQAKEDAHRASGREGSSLVYSMPGTVRAVKLWAFFPKDMHDPKIELSADDKVYRALEAKSETWFDGAGDYGYWKPVFYHAQGSGRNRFVRIELTGETQVGRVEIQYEPSAAGDASRQGAR